MTMIKFLPRKSCALQHILRRYSLLLLSRWFHPLFHSEYHSSKPRQKQSVIMFLYFRFTGSVKLRAIMLIGGEDGSHPKTMKL